MNNENTTTLNQIGEAVTQWKQEAIIGADFNCTPEEVAATSAVTTMGARVVAARAPRGTCTGSRKAKKPSPGTDSRAGEGQRDNDEPRGTAPHLGTKRH